MAQRGDCVYYVGKYARGDDGVFTGQLDDSDEDTVDIVEAMDTENQIKTKRLQDIFYFVKNSVARVVGTYNISIKQDIYLHINGEMRMLITIMKNWQTANNKPLKLPREQAWKYLRRMVNDGTIPDEGEKATDCT